MRVVVDTNIVFSALLNTDSNIAQIILQPKTRLNFYSTEKLREDIKKHQDKILSLTNYSDSELERMIEFISTRKIFATKSRRNGILVSEDLIKSKLPI